MVPSQDMRELDPNVVTRARLAAIISSTADAMIAATLDGTIIDWNPAAERLFGYSAAEIIGQSLGILAPLERAHETDELLACVGQGKSVEAFETIRRTKDGRYIGISLSVSPIRGDAGQIIGCSGIARDMTSRIETEAALAHERDLLRTLMESFPDAIYFKDAAGRFTRVNRAAAALYGLQDPEAAIGKTDFDVYPEERAREFWNAERDMLDGGTPLVNRLEHQSGEGDETCWTLATKVPLTNRDGQITGLIGISRDVTDVMRAQEALRRSEARFRSLITNATDIITILAADGTVLYESPPIERILGYDRDELLGRNAFDLVHPEDRAATWAAFEQALADPEFVPTVEFRFQHREGSWRWLESTGTNLLGDKDVGGFVVNSRDITERKRLDQELLAALNDAQAANRATGQFLAMMSHELRTPMQAVLGYADLLLAELQDSLPPDQIEDIQAIHRGAERMIGLVTQILDLSRLQAGQLTLAIKPVDLMEVIEQVRQDVVPQARAKALDLLMELPPDLPLVHADPDRLHQILLNLVGNAVKFTEAGAVRIAARTVDDRIEVAVTDTGLGIPAETLPHIFEEFRQADRGMTRRYEGAGLGLAIAKKLTEQMGGEISVTSQPGVGSTFTLHLPPSGTTDASAENGRPPAKVRAQERPTGTRRATP